MVLQAKALIVIFGKASIVLTQYEKVCVFNDNGIGYIGGPTASAPLALKVDGLEGAFLSVLALR